MNTSPMTGLILAATEAHVPALVAIHAASFPPDQQWGADTICLQLGLPGGFGLMHLGGGMVLARVTADESEILTLAVMPDRRRDGMGGTLLRAAMAEATRRGARVMFLEVGVANLPAQTLYARAGFVEVGLRPNYYPDGSDALVLRADLVPPAS